MHTVRRLSMPFMQPISRLFHHDHDHNHDHDNDNDNDDTALHQQAIEETQQHHSTAVSASSPDEALTQVATHPGVSVSRVEDADLPLPMQDALYIYQLSQAQVLKLSPVAFRAADIVWRLKDSELVYHTLRKKGIIAPDGEIKTACISNKFAHQFAFLTGFGQRRVIGLLFWWEEEEQRLKQLFAQLHDIDQALKRAQESQDRAMIALLKVELERTKMLIKQKPSERCSDTASSRGREPLPVYSPPAGGSREQLPIYTEDPRTFITG